VMVKTCSPKDRRTSGSPRRNSSRSPARLTWAWVGFPSRRAETRSRGARRTFPSLSVKSVGMDRMIPLRISFPSATTAMRSVTVSEASVPISASTSKRTMRSWAGRGDAPHRSIQAIHTESSSEPVFLTAVSTPRAHFLKGLRRLSPPEPPCHTLSVTAFSAPPLPWRSTLPPWRRWHRCLPASPLQSQW
jgi:hypothetical protein